MAQGTGCLVLHVSVTYVHAHNFQPGSFQIYGRKRNVRTVLANLVTCYLLVGLQEHLVLSTYKTLLGLRVRVLSVYLELDIVYSLQ
jgi:hypothetical protein